MNKSLLLLAAAAMTLAACSNSDELTGNAGNGTDASSAPTAVQFSTYLAGGQTRAGSGGTVGAQTTSTLQTQGFGVFAYNTGINNWSDANTTYTPNFMYNQKVHVETGTAGWKYEPIKYWPNDFSDGNVDNKQGTNGEENNATGSEKGSKLSFFAYAPFVEAKSYKTASTELKYKDAESSAIETAATEGGEAYATGITGMTFNTYQGEPKVRYVLGSTDYTKEVDLLWGLAGKKQYNLAAGDPQPVGAYNTDLTKQAVNEKIAFNFQHALARLGGNIKTTTTETETDESKQHVKIILDVDNKDYDASTAITGGSKHVETLVTVNSIKIRDYQTYAETEKGTKYTTTTTGNLRTQGWFNIATGKWDEPADGDVQKTGTTTVSYSSEITPDGGEGKTKLNDKIAEPTTKPTYNFTNKKWNMDGVTTTAQGVYATTDAGTDNGILMIPDKKDVQTLVVTVNYTVRTADNHLTTVEGENQGGTKITQEITNAVNIPADALTSNKVYTLLIHLGLTSVKFSAEVANWADATTPDNPSGDPDDPNNKSSENNKDIYLPSNTLAATVNADAKADMTADATNATYNLSNLPAGAKIDATSVSVKKGNADVADATVTLGDITDGTATVKVDGLSANESTTDTVTYTVKFNVLNSQGTTLQKITLTITQAAKKSE